METLLRAWLPHHPCAFGIPPNQIKVGEAFTIGLKLQSGQTLELMLGKIDLLQLQQMCDQLLASEVNDEQG